MFDEEFLFVDRTCRTCLRRMSLTDNFYMTRPDKAGNVSAYSYECKYCTIKRTARNRKQRQLKQKSTTKIIDIYPDW